MVVIRRLLIGLVLVAGFAASGAISPWARAVAAPAEYNPVRHHPMTEPEEDVQRILVKLRGAADTAALASRSHLSLKSSRHILSGLHALHVQPQIGGQSLAETLAALRADPTVEYAEPDQRRYAHATPNDPLFTGQWFLQAGQPAAINAMGAWDLTTGSSGVVIAELDTGVRFDHPDLRNTSANRLLPGYDFISADPNGQFQTANDGDGRDADPSDPGDWVTQTDTQSTQFKSCDVSNSSWHGTRVAGILGAITNNSSGIAGITWTNWILPVRVLGKCGGYDSDIMAAMVWAAGVHVDGVADNRYPARIINMSLGATGSCTAGYSQVIGQLKAMGVLVVVSAGNEGGPVDSPANCSGAAGIAGLRQVGTKVGFSSLGPEIALSAPGGNCVNTGAGQPCLFSLDTTINTGTTTPGTNTYTDQTSFNVGTSFSAPIVAGIAGLMLAVNGNLNSSQLISRLQEGATKPFPVSTDPTVPQCHLPTGPNDLQTAECSCTTQVCGAGMANAQGAVAAALRPIAAVAVPTSVAAGTNVTLNGSGSAAACNHTIASYSWTVVSPTANPPAIQNANAAAATVVAPVAPSTYTLKLTVTDDAGRTDSADVVVTSTGASTTAAASAGSNACPTPISFSTSSPSSGGNSGSSGASGGSGGGGGGGGAIDPMMVLAAAAGIAGRLRRYRMRAAMSSHDRCARR